MSGHVSRNTSGRARDRKTGAFARLRAVAPEVAEAYDSLAGRSVAAGPLDAASVAVVKVALSVGQGSWRGVHAHARKALEAGVGADALRQVALVAMPTLGLHTSLDALRWIEEIIDEARPTGDSR